jgi:hypothetical protein
MFLGSQTLKIATEAQQLQLRARMEKKPIQREVASSPIVSRIVEPQPKKREETRATAGRAFVSAEH